MQNNATIAINILTRTLTSAAVVKKKRLATRQKYDDDDDERVCEWGKTNAEMGENVRYEARRRLSNEKRKAI